MSMLDVILHKNNKIAIVEVEGMFFPFVKIDRGSGLSPRSLCQRGLKRWGMVATDKFWQEYMPCADSLHKAMTLSSRLAEEAINNHFGGCLSFQEWKELSNDKLTRTIEHFSPIELVNIS